MNAHVRTAIKDQGKRRTYAVLYDVCSGQVRVIRLAKCIDLTDSRVVDRMLIDFPIARNPVRHCVRSQVEFGAFVCHNELPFFHRRNVITEGKTIIGHTENNAQFSARFHMNQAHFHLRTRRLNRLISTPLHRVGLLNLTNIDCLNLKTVQQIIRIRKIESQL